MPAKPTENAAPAYRVEQVSARTGLTKRTLRYYEEIGLLVPTARSEGNYRLYSETDVVRLERICRLKEALGLTLAELSELMQTEDERAEIRINYQETHDPAQRLEQLARAEALTRQQLALVEAKLHTLNEARTAMQERLDRYAALRREIVATETTLS